MRDTTEFVTLADARLLGSGNVGCKASNLSVLLAEGFHVPAGFCIPTHVLSELAARCGVDSLSMQLPDVSRRLRSGLVEDLALREALRRNCGELSQSSPRGCFAVRSSATVEDSGKASFAGQFRTVLGVTVEGITEAVLDCWLSLWEPSGILYAKSMDVALDVSSFAILVQLQIRSRFSGVAFSMNPISGSTNEVIIEGTQGLGGPVVAGEIIPSRAVVSKESWLLLERDSGNLQKLLSEDLCREVALLCHQVEVFFGVPQDIEWAVDGSRLWLLQARPVTT